MSPEEVLAKLKTMGINSSRATLLRYKEAGLIPKPEEGGGGRGVGRFTDYPNHTVNEYFASYHIIKGKHASPEQTATARGTVIGIIDHPIGFMWEDAIEFEKKVIMDLRADFSGHSSGLNENEIFNKAETVNDDGYGKEMFFLYKNVINTKFAIEWWELKQIAEGCIDDDYVILCDHVRWKGIESFRGNSELIDSVIDHLKTYLQGLIEDIQMLQSIGEERPENFRSGLVPLGRWIVLYKLYPEMQLMVKNAMLINYRGVKPAIFDLLVTRKLPEV